MNATDLLQQIGLTKYEAEAYYTLLREGALTGYELGKRSAVPLSRSYEVLERLSQKGLVLVQPGDPPRFRAEEPDRLLEQIRTTVGGTLDALARELRALPLADSGDEFWVLRNRGPILARARAMIYEAGSSIALALAAGRDEELEAIVSQAEARRTQGVAVTVAAMPVPRTLLLLVDRDQALVGTLAPQDRCQAVLSGNRALVHAVDGSLRSRRAEELRSHPVGLAASAPSGSRSWLAWDEDKQRRLLRLTAGRDVA